MANDERKEPGLPPDHGVVPAREAAPDPNRTAPMPPDPSDPTDRDATGREATPNAPPRPGTVADVNDHDTLEPASDRFLGAGPDERPPRS